MLYAPIIAVRPPMMVRVISHMFQLRGCTRHETPPLLILSAAGPCSTLFFKILLRTTTNMSFKDNPGQLCPVCTDIDLVDALDASHFADLPPYDSANLSEWRAHIRVIHTFTLDRVAASGQFCTLCSLLKRVATRLADHRTSIPRSSLFAPNGSSAPIPPDGEGYTLAALPSESVFRQPAVDASQGQTSDQPLSVLLLVLKGSTILERLAHEARADLRTKIAGAVVDRAVAHAKEHGTIISATTMKPISDISHVHFRLVKADRIDYDAIRTWISRCADTHPACQNEGGYVPGMKVIDCATRKIVKPQPETRYAALSYVWGKGAPEEYVYPSLPVDLPLVIEDALIVCKKLGIPYIWIDRYCIWQDDPVHKMGQINRMDEIYGNALVTIAAAAGNGSNHPLPGVGLPRHQGPQIHEQVGETTLVADYGYSFQRLRLEKSKWFTRGWTFQELALSRRVLFFTDYRVSFQCLSAECLEHLSGPISLQDGMRSSTTQRDLHTQGGIKTLMLAYSKRDLSYDSDSFNAIAGIFRAWSHNNPRCRHIMGVPIVLPEEDKRTPKSLFLSLWDGLTWSLALSHLRQGTRREGFPTWSWLGIRGQLQVGNSELMQPSLSGLVEDSIIDGRASIETQGYVVHKWTDFATSDKFSQYADSITAIHLEGWSFEVGPFTTVKVDTRNLFCLEVAEPAGILRFHPDLGTATTEEDLQQPLEAVSPYGLEESRCALVFKRIDGAVQRVGILQLLIWGIDEAGKLYPRELCDLEQTFSKVQKKMFRLV